jgi:asparagine synthase (glutamine-hydrolysing)
MCGIVGLWSRDINDIEANMSRMTETLHHRGPDDYGCISLLNKGVGLGHRRLAVIDLSKAGHQPMSDKNNSLFVVFNGEIYNFRKLRSNLQKLGHIFSTETDTEVLIEAYREWGVGCLDYLVGMFAFCIFDKERNRMFLARDRAGEKPLYYHFSNNSFIFASELKAIMALPKFPRRLNVTALNSYLTYGYVPREMCILKDIQKLPQGHAMTFEIARQKLQVWKYWELPSFQGTLVSNDEEILEELESRLKESIKNQLIADVPVGVLLSGGLDSSLITAIASKMSSEQIKTFTVTFPGQSVFNEATYARKISDYFGTEHRELVAEKQSVDLLPRLAAQFDEPLGDSSLVPTYLVSKLIREHATVALGGDGGDELFGGYKNYSRILQIEYLRRFIPTKLSNSLLPCIPKVFSAGMKGRNFLQALFQDKRKGVADLSIICDMASRKEILQPLWNEFRQIEQQAEEYRNGLLESFRSPLQNATATDFSTYLVDDILVKVDRASMLASLEMRSPWLDHRLIEFAFRGVPDRLKATCSRRKILLQRLGKKLLPEDMDLKRKQGFSLPINAWLKGEWGNFIYNILSEVDTNIFSQQAVQSLIDDQKNGLSNHHRIFNLTMFELWRRHYAVTI